MLESEQRIEHLLVIEDNQGKRTIALEAATCSVGRDLTNSIVLYSDLVSRHHATLVRLTMPETTTYLFRIIDGNLKGKRSKNGLIVNGRHCFSHDLQHGDVISFGGDVRARYYATANQSDVEFLTSGTEDVSGFLSTLSNPFQKLITSDNDENSNEAALVRLASFPELISNPILEIDLAGSITYLNPAALVQFPDIREAKLQHPVLAGLVARVQHSQEEIFVREVEIAGKVFEQSVNYIPESELIRSYVVDVSDRKQIELALRGSEQMLQSVMDNIPQFIFWKDRNYVYLGCNRNFAQAAGADAPEHIIGKTDYELPWQKEEAGFFRECDRRVMETDTPEYRIIEPLLRADGKQTWLETNKIPLHDLGGNVVGILGTFEDITSRKQAEIDLQQAHDELEIRVEERTAQLRQINEQLRGEIVERQRVEKEALFLQTITQAISESSNFHSALEVVLQKVCDFTGWKFGEAWIPDSDGTTLECSPAWYGASQKLDKFRQSSEGFRFSPGAGLPGRVWSSRHPEWLRDVSNEPDTVFLRKQFVTEAGFKAGLGIPIIDNNQVLAVIVFFMFESCEEDKRLVEIVSTVTPQLGSLIQRKRAESALRESEDRFRAVVEQTSEGIFLVDADTKQILEANAAYYNLLGYTLAEILGLTLYDIVALDRESIDRNVQRILQEKHFFISEAQHCCKDGSIVTVEVNINLIFSGGKEVFCVLAHDITERKRVEVALRESEERLNAILDNSTALIYVKDLQGKYILVNAWFGILFHLDREDVIGKTDYDIFPKEMADVLRLNDQKVLEARSPLDWEEVVPQDDDLHTYLSIKFPLYDVTGVPYAICGISTDITERKRAEVALRSSVATNRALLNAIPDLMFRINTNGIFVNFKAAKASNLLMPSGEILGKHLYEVLPTEIAQPAMNSVEKALSTGEVQIFESQLLVNNKLLNYEFRIAVSAEDEVMAIVRDITERKRAEADIRSALEKEKELGELKSSFVTMTSHEFRTPLATILSSTELLEHYSYKWSEEKKLTHFQRIQVSVKHMTGLLNDVLLIGKAEAGKLEFNPTSLDITKFCCDLVEEMELTASKHKIAFSTPAFCTQNVCLTACMDEKLLRHILSNLLSNAIKYSPHGGTVYFDLACEQGNAIFQIKDEGIGIPVADQEQLFNSFHRASNVGTISGTGLGLAIVKKSVDLHGGKISVKSEINAGTTFTVTLPLSKQV